ncbi:MAG: hypothetical protein V4456_02695 [Bacteroidota bacterium]
MKLKLSTSLLLSILSLTSFAQSASVQLDSLIHKKVFHYNNNHFEGEGWNVLLTEINKAQIVLLGEQHGEAEIPVFTIKVAEVLKPKALITEIDPYTARQLQKISIDTAGYSAYFKENPYDFAFYSYQTEMELARQMTLAHTDIWGLNEINFLSLGTFFNTLAGKAKLPANKILAQKRAKQYASHDRLIYKDINRYSDFIAYKIKPASLDSLLYAFRNESNECKKMLRDLKASLPIYANTSYQMRVNLMKKNLLNYLSPYITTDSIRIPKLLFKLGANHVPRTNDLRDFFEVGNLASNLAEASGKTSLHIMIFGKAGTVNQMAPTNNRVAIQPYDAATDKDLDMFKPFYSPVSDQEWVLYDLRPIRDAVNDGKLSVNRNLKGFIMGYDLLVVFGHSTGNRFIE